MNYLLAYHPDRYQISFLGGLLSVATGLSGAPIANRHMAMASIDSDHALAHRVIGLIEYIPILGAVVALIERVAYAIFVPSAVQNMIKAVHEHRVKDPTSYATLKQAIPSYSELYKKETTSLQFSDMFADDIGPRPQMEDAHFYKETKQRVLTGVFDGHGGDAVSVHASRLFERHFSEILKKTNGDVRKAFEMMIDSIHLFVNRNPDLHQMGSTAVVCFIDKETHQIYTATLGDSEANIYREINGKTVSIPLSCVRDWTSKKDYNRLCKFHKMRSNHEILDFIKRHNDQAKVLRSGGKYGVNVARAIGDYECSPVSQKPKITINKLKSGDKLVIACDGLKDYVPEKEVIKIAGEKTLSVKKANNKSIWNFLCRMRQPNHLANRLVKKAMDVKAKDNVTVVAIDIA